MAALSFSVHSATTLALISFMYSMKALRGFLMWGFFSSSFFTAAGDFLQGAGQGSAPHPGAAPGPTARPHSRAASGAGAGLGGLLLDDGRDDGGVRDARGVQPVRGRRDHVRGEAAGHQTAAGGHESRAGQQAAKDPPENLLG